jgi:RNA polymerase sigma-70 factor (family 1)
LIKKADNDKELLKKIAEGDEKAFGVLFFNHLSVLQAFALKFTKSEYAAEEIIQNSFFKICINRDKLEEVENVKAYLYKYVSNECLNYLRKALKDSKIIDAVKNHQEESSNNTVDSINFNEITAIAAKLIEKLSPQRKNIYKLSRQEGKSIPEIAEILNISPNTVKNTLVETLKIIRLGLEKSGIIFLFLLLAYCYPKK